MKKIFFIIPDLRCGGAEKVFINLANSFGQNFEVTFILMSKTGSFLDQLNSNIKIISLNAHRFRNIFFKLIKIFNNYRNAYFISAMWPLNSVVLFCSLFGNRSNKYLITEHINLSQSNGVDFKTNPLLMKLVISFTYPFAYKIICVSNGVKDDLYKNSFYPLKNLVRIYNPIIKDIYKKNKKINNKINLLNVATLKEQKDHKTLIDSFYLLKNKINFHLNIVGDGPLRSQLKNYVKKLNLENKITFHGYQSNLDFFYKNNDIFILTSTHEGFGNVLVEALSYGLQIISTDCPSGPSEILDNGRYGTLVKIKNPEQICQSICNLIDKEFVKDDLYNRALDFKISKIFKEYLILLNE